MADDNNTPDSTDVNHANQMAAAIKELNKMLKEMKNSMSGVEAATKRTATAQSGLKADLEKSVELLEEESILYESVGQKASGIKDSADYLIAAVEARVAIQEKEDKMRLKALEDLKEMGAISDEAYLQRLGDLKASQKQADVYAAQLLHLKGQQKLVGNISGKIKGMSGIGEELGIAGQFAAAFANGKDLKSVIGEVASELGTAEMAALAFDSSQEKMTEGIVGLIALAWQQAMAVDSAQASVRKLTGGMESYNAMIEDTYQANTLYGVSAEESGQATADLFENVSQFTEMSRRQQESLQQSAVLLNEAGVSTETFTAGVEMSMKALGRTADEARRSQEALLLFARDLGMSPQKMSEEFANAGPVLAKFSYNAERQFRDVAKAAKATGMEISRIMDYTQQFDTFEGAADKVGSLNAMLGGDFVNAMDLMAAENPAERMKMITDAIHDSGRAFEEMSYYEKMAIAEAGGFQDVAELQRAMSGDMDSMNQSTAEQAAEQERLQQIAATNQSTMEKFEATIAAMAPSLGKVMESFRKLLEYIEPLAPYLHYAVIALGAMKVVMFGVQVATAAATLKTKLKTLATGMDTAANVTHAESEVADATATGTGSVATDIDTASTGKNTFAQNLNFASIMKNVALFPFRIAKTLLLAGAKGTMAIATGVATAAQWAFNIAMNANPIGLVILAVVALGAVLYKLATDWEGTVAVFKKVGIVLFQVITFPIRAAVAAVIGMFNMIIKGANKLPLVNIPLIPQLSGAMAGGIPMLEEGAHSFPGGQAIVGERGPELVDIPRGASVSPQIQNIPNAKTTSGASLASKAMTGGGKPTEVHANFTGNIILDGDKVGNFAVAQVAKEMNPARS